MDVIVIKRSGDPTYLVKDGNGSGGKTQPPPQRGMFKRMLSWFWDKEGGMIKAADPKGADEGEAANADQTLPDPTHRAVTLLAVLVALSVIVAVVLNMAGWTASQFKPASSATVDFALFAAFYVGAQVIERLMQFVSPLLPPWKTAGDEGPAKAAQIKADRGTVGLGVAAVLGVVASCAFGLFFLTAFGIHANHTIDAFVTGVTIAAGTKPLHDFISLLQNKTSPKTETTT